MAATVAPPSGRLRAISADRQVVPQFSYAGLNRSGKLLNAALKAAVLEPLEEVKILVFAGSEMADVGRLLSCNWTYARKYGPFGRVVL